PVPVLRRPGRADRLCRGRHRADDCLAAHTRLGGSMAVLSDPDRVALWAKLMQDASASRTPLPLLKAELRAAVDAADAWADANAAAYNTARTALTTKQKALLLMYVIERRWEVSP